MEIWSRLYCSGVTEIDLANARVIQMNNEGKKKCIKQLLPRIEVGPHKMKGKESGECVSYLHIGGQC